MNETKFYFLKTNDGRYVCIHLDKNHPDYNKYYLSDSLDNVDNCPSTKEIWNNWLHSNPNRFSGYSKFDYEFEEVPDKFMNKRF